MRRFVFPRQRSVNSSVKLSGRHTTQIQTSEVRWAARFGGHWVVMFACFISNSQEAITQATKKPQMEDVPNLINFGPTKPIQILHQHEIFEGFVCVLQMILFTKINNLDVNTGAQQQKQEVY